MQEENMDYVKTILKDEFFINNVITVHYFEFAKDYVFKGEFHDFWEFVYVDKGEVEVMADDKGYKLKQGDMIFHKPNEFHNLWANGKVAPNLIVISFDCRSKSMNYFENKIISVGDTIKKLLASLLKEAMEAFSNPLNLSVTIQLEKKDNSYFGCEQLIKIYLQQILIYLVRKGTNISTEERLSSSVKERWDEDVVNIVIKFLENNINSNISFEDVCKYSSLGKTNLKMTFKEKTGTSVMEYYKSLKIQEAKNLIRETELNFTQISERLGYTSIHYFSRHFKKVTGMTPSEYSYSVKAKLQ
jgi:AraC-like DNA-binding protein